MELKRLEELYEKETVQMRLMVQLHCSTIGKVYEGKRREEYGGQWFEYTDDSGQIHTAIIEHFQLPSLPVMVRVEKASSVDYWYANGYIGKEFTVIDVRPDDWEITPKDRGKSFLKSDCTVLGHALPEPEPAPVDLLCKSCQKIGSCSAPYAASYRAARKKEDTELARLKARLSELVEVYREFFKAYCVAPKAYITAEADEEINWQECEWISDGEDIISTNCGKQECIDEDGKSPADYWTFCPYCGRVIKPTK